MLRLLTFLGQPVPMPAWQRVERRQQNRQEQGIVIWQDPVNKSLQLLQHDACNQNVSSWQQGRQCSRLWQVV